MLEKGAKLYQTEHSNRNSKDKHYGIGMYFADCVAKQHKGAMVLDGSEKLKGAKTKISFESVVGR